MIKFRGLEEGKLERWWEEKRSKWNNHEEHRHLYKCWIYRDNVNVADNYYSKMANVTLHDFTAAMPFNNYRFRNMITDNAYLKNTNFLLL